MRAISDEEGANRNRFPTGVYDGELVYILPNVKMTFKLDGDVDTLPTGYSVRFTKKVVFDFESMR